MIIRITRQATVIDITLSWPIGEDCMRCVGPVTTIIPINCRIHSSQIFNTSFASSAVAIWKLTALFDDDLTLRFIIPSYHTCTLTNFHCGMQLCYDYAIINTTMHNNPSFANQYNTKLNPYSDILIHILNTNLMQWLLHDSNLMVDILKMMAMSWNADWCTT